MTQTPESAAPSPSLTQWVLHLLAARMRINEFDDEKIRAALDERRAALAGMDADKMMAKILGELTVMEIHRSAHGPH